MISRFLLKVYFLLLPFKTLPNFSDFLPKATLADFLYVPIGLAALGEFKKMLDRKWWGVLDCLAIAWFLVEVLSWVLSGSSLTALGELAATFYLVCLYFSVRLLVEPKHVAGMVNAVIVSGFLLGALAIGGWLTAMAMQDDSIFVLSIKSYPYLGNVYRARALTGSPNMLLSILTLGILFCWARLLQVADHRFINSTALVVMVVALLLTFSRGVLVVLACMAVIKFLSLPATSRAKRSARVMLLLSFLSATSAFVAVSHVVVTPNKEAAVLELVGGGYIKGDRPLFILGHTDTGYAFYPSIYIELKKAACLAFLDSRGLGIGGGNFNQYLSVLKGRGLYPEKFTVWDPHSTYFGVLAEHGLIGFLTVCGIFAFLCRKSFSSLRSPDDRHFVSIGFAGVFVAITIEAICVDVMNFRQYWVLFALAAIFHSTRSHVQQGAEVTG